MTSTPTNTQPTKGAGPQKKKKAKKSSTENILAATGGSEIAATLLGDKITDSANGSQVGREKTEKEYLKEVSRRLRKQAKKMENIKRSEEKIKDLTEEEQATVIKLDEQNKIKTKPITSAVYEELSSIAEVLKKVADAEDKRSEEEKAEADAKFASAVAEAREEGRKAGAEEATAKILTVVRFLRLAGYRRMAKSGNDQEDEAIERLLVLVYGGDQTAVDACLKLASGSDENIDDFGITYGQIKETAHALKLGNEEEQSEQPETEATEPEAAEATTTDTELAEKEENNDGAPTYNDLVEAAEESTSPQALTNGEAEVPASAPTASLTADEAANEEAKIVEPAETAFEAAPETEAVPDETPVELPTTDAPTSGSWADEDVRTTEAAVPAVPEPREGEFQSVERRGGRGGRGGYRGSRGEFRGGFRGGPRGEYRSRGGEFRPRGDGEYRPRGDRDHRPRGDGEHRHRGDGEGFRSRGDGEYRSGRGGYRYRDRGDGENRGGYRNRGRGDYHHQGPRPQQQQQPQQPSEEPTAESPTQQPDADSNLDVTV